MGHGHSCDPPRPIREFLIGVSHTLHLMLLLERPGAVPGRAMALGCRSAWLSWGKVPDWDRPNEEGASVAVASPPEAEAGPLRGIRKPPRITYELEVPTPCRPSAGRCRP